MPLARVSGTLTPIPQNKIMRTSRHQPGCAALARRRPRRSGAGQPPRAPGRRAAACSASGVRSVGIVGAGPSGLALAHALARFAPDIRVEVLERNSDVRPPLGAAFNLNGKPIFTFYSRISRACFGGIACPRTSTRRLRGAARAGGAAMLHDLGLGDALRSVANPLRSVLCRTARTAPLPPPATPQPRASAPTPFPGASSARGRRKPAQVGGFKLLEISTARAVRGHEAELVRDGEARVFPALRADPEPGAAPGVAARTRVVKPASTRLGSR